MIHYTQIIWDEVVFIWKVTGKAVAIFMTGTVVAELWTLQSINDDHQRSWK